MIIPIKKILLESFTKGTLLHEIRYILTISDSNFNKLPPKLCTREDWYFKDYRIRKYNCKQKNQFQWIKIMNSSSGLVKKKSITIKEPSKEELQKADLYLNIVSKRPIIKGKELYLDGKFKYDVYDSIESAEKDMITKTKYSGNMIEKAGML